MGGVGKRQSSRCARERSGHSGEGSIPFGWSQERTVVAKKGSLERDSPDVAEQPCRAPLELMQTTREVVLIAHPATPE